MPESSAGLEAHLRELEERLLQPEVRASHQELSRLLADEFLEFGSSGRTYNKPGILAALSSEEPSSMSLTDFRCRIQTADVALVTYRSTGILPPGSPTPSRASHRSSLWIRRDGRWQLLFHQGTPIPS